MRRVRCVRLCSCREGLGDGSLCVVTRGLAEEGGEWKGRRTLHFLSYSNLPSPLLQIHQCRNRAGLGRGEQRGGARAGLRACGPQHEGARVVAPGVAEGAQGGSSVLEWACVWTQRMVNE